MSDLISQLQDILGPKAVVTGEALTERAISYWDSSPTQAKALLRPESTQAISEIMRLCHEHGQPVVVQGGLTGIVSGTATTSDEIIISLERMSSIESIDMVGGTAVIEAEIQLMRSLKQVMDPKNLLNPGKIFE